MNLEEQIRDCAKALVWTYKNIGKYGGNKNNIFLMGHSAGAHLVSMIALDKNYVKDLTSLPIKISGVIPISGGTYEVDKRGNFGRGAFSNLLDEVFGKSAEERKRYSPVYYISKDAPPFLILYGGDEMFFVKRQSKLFYKALKNAGVEAYIKEIRGRRHAGMIALFFDDKDKVRLEVLSFIRKHLK